MQINIDKVSFDFLIAKGYLYMDKLVDSHSIKVYDVVEFKGPSNHEWTKARLQLKTGISGETLRFELLKSEPNSMIELTLIRKWKAALDKLIVTSSLASIYETTISPNHPVNISKGKGINDDDFCALTLEEQIKLLEKISEIVRYKIEKIAEGVVASYRCLHN